MGIVVRLFAAERACVVPVRGNVDSCRRANRIRILAALGRYAMGPVRVKRSMAKSARWRMNARASIVPTVFVATRRVMESANLVERGRARV